MEVPEEDIDAFIEHQTGKLSDPETGGMNFEDFAKVIFCFDFVQ